MNDKYRGAEWIRVDLHLHSPFVKSFKLPSGINLDSDKEKIVRDYVRKIKEKGIQIGAITDYNGIQKEWFIPIRDEAEKEGILILPGVELSISLTGGKYGLHLIVIFDNTIDIDGLNTFLHSLDKDPQEKLLNGREHREINSKYELEEMVKLIREKYKCLIIFAHPEEDKGLFKTFSPKESAKYISIIRPDALEYFSNDWKSRLVDTNEIKKELLERIAILESSDPKSIDEIGNKLRDRKIRATYLKLSDFSLSALKLALHDPEVRVKLYKPPEMFHSRITRVTINGTTFL
ncbi:PHP domain-containing protein, partial [Candidatus Kryptonium thompsonii]